VLEAKDSSKSVGEMRQQPKELNKGIINLFLFEKFLESAIFGRSVT
jgi:hypothetical protein